MGTPLRPLLGPGQQAGCGRAGELLAGATGAAYVLAAKGYDAGQTVARAVARGAQVVIPGKKNRLVRREIDRNL